MEHLLMIYLIHARRLLLVTPVLDRVPPLEGRLRVAVGEALQSGAAPDFQVQEPDWPRPGMKKVLNKVGLSNIYEGNTEESVRLATGFG